MEKLLLCRENRSSAAELVANLHCMQFLQNLEKFFTFGFNSLCDETVIGASCFEGVVEVVMMGLLKVIEVLNMMTCKVQMDTKPPLLFTEYCTYGLCRTFLHFFLNNNTDLIHLGILLKPDLGFLPVVSSSLSALRRLQHYKPVLLESQIGLFLFIAVWETIFLFVVEIYEPEFKVHSFPFFYFERLLFLSSRQEQLHCL